MTKLKRLVVSLIAILSLAGCTSKSSSRSSSKSSKEISTSVGSSSSSSAASSATSAQTSASSSTSAGSSGTSTPSSSSSGTSSTSSSSTPIESVTVYDAAKVCADFNAKLESEGYGSLAAEWDSEYQEYSTGANFGESTDESEENLLSAVETFAYFLPEYMEVSAYIYGDPTSEDYYDLFGDNSIYCYAEFTSPDEISYAAIVSYIYSGYLFAQVSIANCE